LAVQGEGSRTAERRMKQDRNSNSNIISFLGARKRIQPSSDLTAEELGIFRDVVESRAPSHFAESDKPLFAAYCTAVHLSRLYAERNDNDVARKMRLQTAKLAAILANRLRLASR
jgi:hypothetical protein